MKIGGTPEGGRKLIGTNALRSAGKWFHRRHREVSPPIDFDATPDQSALATQTHLRETLISYFHPELDTEPKILETLYGNVSVDEAEVIGFAEQHNSPSYYAAISERITQLAQPGDILLIEGCPQGTEIPPDNKNTKNYRVPSFLRIEGWEDMTIFEKTGDFNALLVAAKAFSDALPRSLQEIEVAKQGVFKALAEFAKVNLNDRNPFLLEAIKNARSRIEGHHVFFIAGKAHIEGDSMLRDELSKYNYIVLGVNEPESNFDLNSFLDQHGK